MKIRARVKARVMRCISRVIRSPGKGTGTHRGRVKDRYGAWTGAHKAQEQGLAVAIEVAIAAGQRRQGRSRARDRARPTATATATARGRRWRGGSRSTRMGKEEIEGDDMV